MSFSTSSALQDINVQNISGAALSGLVASGEVPLSPTIFNSNIFTHKQQGAPVDWRLLDPVIAGGEALREWWSIHLILTLLFSFLITSIRNSVRRSL